MSQTARLNAGQRASRKVIEILAPFGAKDRIKSSGALWNPQRKVWYLEWSALGARSMARELENAGYGVQCDDQVSSLLRGAADRDTAIAEREPDYSSVLAPRPYQRLAVRMILRMSGCVLAWDMGTGKTKAVIDAVLASRETADPMRRVLVVAPKSVVGVWSREADKHWPAAIEHELVTLPLDRGTVAKRRELLRRALVAQSEQQHKHTLIVAINYEAAIAGKMAELLAETDWDLAIADESHRLMNHASKTAKFMSDKIRPRARRRVCLTGTPIANHPGDLFGQLKFADPGVFGTSWWNFKSRWLRTQDHPFPKIHGIEPDRSREFQARLDLVMHRVRVDDVLDLHDAIDERIEVELSKDTRKIYVGLRDELVAQVEAGEITVSNAMVKMLRLQQVANGVGVVAAEDPRDNRTYDIGSEKLDATSELIQGIDRSHAVVIFAQFRRDIERLHAMATAIGREPYVLRGGLDQHQQWRDSAEIQQGPVLIVQRRAGGVGIDLTASRYCINYSGTFSSVDWRQSRARQRRHGQRHAVIYYHLIARDTVDDHIMRALERKQSQSDDILERRDNGGADIAAEVMASMTEAPQTA